MQKSTPKFISFLKCQIKKCISIVFPTNFHIAVGTFKTFLGKIEKEIFLVRKSAEISPKMNNFTMKKYSTNTVEYWGRIQIGIECIQFWNVDFEYLQKSRIFAKYRFSDIWLHHYFLHLIIFFHQIFNVLSSEIRIWTRSSYVCALI